MGIGGAFNAIAPSIAVAAQAGLPGSHGRLTAGAIVACGIKTVAGGGAIACGGTAHADAVAVTHTGGAGCLRYFVTEATAVFNASRRRTFCYAPAMRGIRALHTVSDAITDASAAGRVEVGRDGNADIAFTSGRGAFTGIRAWEFKSVADDCIVARFRVASSGIHVAIARTDAAISHAFRIGTPTAG